MGTAFLICCLTLSLQAQNTRNWTYTEVYDENGNPISQSKTYLDKFGRAEQSMSRSFSTNQLILTQTLYDQLGVAAIQTLPFPLPYVNFDYKDGIIKGATGNDYSRSDFDGSTTLNSPRPVGRQTGTVGWYYSNSNTNEPYVARTNYPYSRTWTERDPDPKIAKNTLPGDQYHLGSGKEIISERQKIATGELDHYFDLRHWFTTENITYNTNLGYKVISTDPDGNQAVTFTNAAGQPVASALPDGVLYKFWSYSYYNDVGQLVATVAPKGVNTASVARPDFVTYFRYDEYGNLIEVEDPDEGISQFMYTLDGRIRFSQNAEQKSRGNNIFSYTHYDVSGRLIESGEYHGTLLFNSTALQALLETPGKLWPDTEVTDWSKVVYDLPAPDFPTDASHDKQRFTIGAITTTENANAKTWYSYDEYGRVTFTKKWIKALNKYVTLDYTYDYLGNVITVAYQQEVPGEAFYHHYEYDADQRLTSVKTSVDGQLANAYLHATYHYYLHGPLKRIELAEDLQGIDFVYTAQGSLKAVNHPDHTADPGRDGTNGFHTDVFGMTMEYFEGDYDRTGTSIGSTNFNEAEIAANYNGNIRALNYGRNALGLPHPNPDHLVKDQFEVAENNLSARKTITLKPGFDTQGNTFDAAIDPLGHYYKGDEPSKTQAFNYDLRNQLEEAVYGDQVGFSYTSQQYRVDNLAYDENGNINTLQRNNEQGTPLHNFAYNYDPANNRLLSITGYASYLYDEIGRLEGVDYDGTTEDLYLEYDAYQNVRNIYADAAKTQRKVSFLYDDGGFRLMKKNHDLDLETWYIRDANGNLISLYYRYQGQLFQGELPIYGASRLGIAFRNTSHYKYNYELTDHLGNVRAVISKLKFMETATMENELAVTEEKAFANLPETRHPDAVFNHTPNALVTGASNVVWLKGSAGRHVGPTKSLQVKAGDIVKMDVYANFVDNNPSSELALGLGGLLGGAYGFAADDETVLYLDAINAAIGGPAAVVATPGAGIPKAYLQYLLFDNNFNYLASIPVGNTYDMVSVNARVMHDAMGQVINVPHEHLELEVAVPQDGYMFIYLVNESRDDTDVYFDDFTISHIGVDILKTTDFYPFGLALKNWQKEDYRFGYQGQFAEMDEETGWNSFELRMYDPVIGRWLSTDPYGEFFSPYISVGNNPISGVDPTGGLTGTDPIKAFVAAGGTVLDEVVVTSTRISTSTIVGGISGAGRVIASSGLEVEFNIPTPRELIGIGLGGPTYTPNTLQSIGYNLTNYQLKPVDPTFFDFWSESTNIIASSSYEMVDGIYLTLQTFYRLPLNRIHLNGAGVMGADLTDGFVNTATLLAPGGLASRTVKTSAGGIRLMQFTKSTIDDAIRYASTPRKLEHLFAAKHKLGPLVQELGGKQNTIKTILNAANGKFPSSGIFHDLSVNVSGYIIYLRGNVHGGIPKIGTMFMK